MHRQRGELAGVPGGFRPSISQLRTQRGRGSRLRTLGSSRHRISGNDGTGDGHADINWSNAIPDVTLSDPKPCRDASSVAFTGHSRSLSGAHNAVPVVQLSDVGTKHQPFVHGAFQVPDKHSESDLLWRDSHADPDSDDCLPDSSPSYSKPDGEPRDMRPNEQPHDSWPDCEPDCWPDCEPDRWPDGWTRDHRPNDRAHNRRPVRKPDLGRPLDFSGNEHSDGHAVYNWAVGFSRYIEPHELAVNPESHERNGCR